MHNCAMAGSGTVHHEVICSHWMVPFLK